MCVCVCVCLSARCCCECECEVFAVNVCEKSCPFSRKLSHHTTHRYQEHGIRLYRHQYCVTLFTTTHCVYFSFTHTCSHSIPPTHTHIHTRIYPQGAFGVDFSAPHGDVNEITKRVRHVGKRIFEHGVTAFCPTMVTSAPVVYKEV